MFVLDQRRAKTKQRKLEKKNDAETTVKITINQPSGGVGGERRGREAAGGAGRMIFR
jgi:hypothetical protein